MESVDIANHSTDNHDTSFRYPIPPQKDIWSF